MLVVENLRTHLFTRSGVRRAVDGVSFSVASSETVSIVGESGCGKSLTGLSLMRLVPDPPARIVGGKVTLDGRDLLTLTENEMLSVRGRELAMIFQDPMTSLNPVATVGTQILEVLQTHTDLPNRAAKDRVRELMDVVGIRDSTKRIRDYPHQLSGGMCQRIMIAIAIACEPKVLIADEPTTALDVTIQAQVISLIQRLQADVGMAVLFITHDLGVVAETADRVLVMYAGQIVEEASVDALFENPLHPYTQGLLAATPSGLQRQQRLAEVPGVVPDLSDMPTGCSFSPRCKFAAGRCYTEPPRMFSPAQGRLVSCFAVEEGR